MKDPSVLNPDKARPPAGFELVGDYAFKPPFVPTIEEVERAKAFVDGHPELEKLEDDDRYGVVIDLSMMAAARDMVRPEGSPDIWFYTTAMDDGKISVQATYRQSDQITRYSIVKNPDEGEAAEKGKK